MSDELNIRIAKLRRLRSVSEGYIDAIVADARSKEKGRQQSLQPPHLWNDPRKYKAQSL